MISSYKECPLTLWMIKEEPCLIMSAQRL